MAVTREKMVEVQTLMSGINEPAPRCPVAHHFANLGGARGGIYAREIFLPAGTIVMGKIHKYETINFITLGMAKAFNPEQPEEDKIMVAPYTFVSPAGSKRCVAALSDCLWITVHPAESKDLAVLEDELVFKDYDELDAQEKTCLG